VLHYGMSIRDVFDLCCSARDRCVPLVELPPTCLAGSSALAGSGALAGNRSLAGNGVLEGNRALAGNGILAGSAMRAQLIEWFVMEVAAAAEEVRLNLYRIFVHFEAVGHEPTILLLPHPTCRAYPTAILLHDHRAIYTPPPNAPFECRVPYNIGNGNIA